MSSKNTMMGRWQEWSWKNSTQMVMEFWAKGWLAVINTALKMRGELLTRHFNGPNIY
jgi:hypothetical protein